MPIYRLNACIVGICWFILTGSLYAKQEALIVIGTTGDPSIAADLSKASQTIRDSLVQRGFAPDSIEIMGAGSDNGNVTSDLVLASLKKRQTLAATDEFWLVLLGFAGRNGDGASAFQVRGPRLAVADLKSALNTIPARQYIFVGTSDSGGFIAPLLQANRAVLSATRADDETDLPRFPDAWAAVLKENPKAGWKEIAARASARNTQYYIDNNLAIGEHACLGDPETGQILEAPFGADKTAKPAETPQP